MKGKHICNLQKKTIITKVFGMLASLVLILTLGLSVPTTSYAYTEEEIAQAKAWLSAHGYSPDAGGASQAYQDYLNGKFDEELGITREPAQSSESSETSETTTEASTTEQTTETAADGKSKKPEKAGQAGNEKSKDNSKTESEDTSSASSDSKEATASKEAATSKEGGKKEEASSENEETASENVEEEPQQDGKEEKEQQDSESDDETSLGQYRNAFLVVLLGVIVMLFAVLFFRKK